jgi:acylphosphatase
VAAAKRVVVSGRVQGVFFRAHVADVARARGVDGWAVNRDDGTVEIHAEGPPDAVEAVIAAAREGSPRAEVEQVDVRDVAAENCRGFSTR